MNFVENLPMKSSHGAMCDVFPLLGGRTNLALELCPVELLDETGQKNFLFVCL